LTRPVYTDLVRLNGETATEFDDALTSAGIDYKKESDSEGNTTVLQEDYQYIDETSYNPYPLPTTVKVEEGTVFVMGDNRYHSADSRDSRIGLVDTRRILGKVVFRISPFSRLGIVK